MTNGFFKAIKSVAESVADVATDAFTKITGGAAKVSLDVQSFSPTEPFQVTVTAQIEDSDIECNRIYLKIQGVEEVKVQGKVNVNDGSVEVKTKYTSVECEFPVSDG